MMKTNRFLLCVSAALLNIWDIFCDHGTTLKLLLEPTSCLQLHSCKWQGAWGRSVRMKAVAGPLTVSKQLWDRAHKQHSHIYPQHGAICEQHVQNPWPRQSSALRDGPTSAIRHNTTADKIIPRHGINFPSAATSNHQHTARLSAGKMQNSYFPTKPFLKEETDPQTSTPMSTCVLSPISPWVTAATTARLIKLTRCILLCDMSFVQGSASLHTFCDTAQSGAGDAELGCPTAATRLLWD